MTDVQEELRKVAKDLLESGEVKMVIGWGESTVSNRTKPLFIEKPEETDKLVLNRNCRNNLSIYLSRLSDIGKLAIVAKPCDVRTIVSLIREKQIERENIHIISFSCGGINDNNSEELHEFCESCDVRMPPVYDTFIGPKEEADNDKEIREKASRFFNLEDDERWEEFKKEMQKCIRCYACRNACPMCYCEECFVERTLPRWVGEGAELSDTMIFHIVRAMHTAGRCGECGACVRACPMGVNFSVIASKINKDVLELFHHRAGTDSEEPPALSTFDPEDYNDFIK